MTEETSKKLQYLKRGDIRTMEKDVAKLREREAESTREKIAQLRTVEEVKKAADLSAEALAGAEERERVEAESKEKLAQSEALRRARQNEELLEGKVKEKSEEMEKEKLRMQFKEAQQKEEEERKKFLENVAEKAGEKPASLVPPPIPEKPTPPPIPPRPTGEDRPFEAARPVPPPILPPSPPLPIPPEEPASVPRPDLGIPPKKTFKFSLPKVQLPKVRLPKVQLPKIQLPKVTIPKVEGYFPAKPSIFAKIWIRIIVSLLILAMLATIATFWYWYLAVRPGTAPAPPETPTSPEKKPESAVETMINEKILQFGYRIPSEPRIIDTIIIHSVYNTLSEDNHSIEGVIEEYEAYKVSAHYLIARDGKIYQTAPKEAIAYHAGVSQMPDGRTDVNNFSVGIELIYTKEETPTETQYQSLTQLIKYLQKEYSIPAQNILGHKDIAPGRKDDPWNFDWNFLNL